jgi:hypothetical protein
MVKLIFVGILAIYLTVVSVQEVRAYYSQLLVDDVGVDAGAVEVPVYDDGIFFDKRAASNNSCVLPDCVKCNPGPPKKCTECRPGYATPSATDQSRCVKTAARTDTQAANVLSTQVKSDANGTAVVSTQTESDGKDVKVTTQIQSGGKGVKIITTQAESSSSEDDDDSWWNIFDL